MVRIANGWIGPSSCVEAKEKLNVAHRISQRAKHVAEKEVSKFDRIQTGQQESPVGIAPPNTTSMVEYPQRDTHHDESYTN